MKDLYRRMATDPELYRAADARRPGPSRTLRCRVIGVEGNYRAPNLMKRHLSDAERLGDLEPTSFTLILEGALTPEDGDAMRALAALSRTGGSVTVRVEVSE